MPKKRLDLLLAELGLVENRTRARAIILSGKVVVNGTKVDKAGTLIDESSQISITEKPHEYVSRGGVKLAHALDTFDINPADKVCIDVGSSTGGFTDCLLKRGAAKVWAIDSGTNQMDYSLRVDNRVVLMEQTNARSLDPDTITDAIDIMVADVSFISLKLVIPPLLPCLKAGAELVLMVKPQFEAGRGRVGKGGVVRDEGERVRIVEGVVTFFTALGLEYKGACDSPIAGPKGNIERFIYLAR